METRKITRKSSEQRLPKNARIHVTESALYSYMVVRKVKNTACVSSTSKKLKTKNGRASRKTTYIPKIWTTVKCLRCTDWSLLLKVLSRLTTVSIFSLTLLINWINYHAMLNFDYLIRYFVAVPLYNSLIYECLLDFSKSQREFFKKQLNWMIKTKIRQPSFHKLSYIQLTLSISNTLYLELLSISN